MATMLMVSCRKDFWSATEFSTTDEIRRVDLDSGAGTTVSQNQFLQEIQSKRLTLLVHGYNNEERDVVDSYGAIDRQMRLLGFLGGSASTYDLLVGFAWPGGATGVSFPFARHRAGESATRFARLLAELRSAASVIDINTHSLGAHVAFEALRTGATRMIRNAWNFASAVDNESIESGERYYQGSQRCENFYVFHSKNDPVLRVWYRIGDLFDFDTALGYSGPEDPADIIRSSRNVRVVNCKEVVHSHGGYRSSGEVWAYMSQQLTGATGDQFVTLSKTSAALNAVFRAAGGAAARTARKPAARKKRLAMTPAAQGVRRARATR